MGITVGLRPGTEHLHQGASAPSCSLSLLCRLEEDQDHFKSPGSICGGVQQVSARGHFIHKMEGG